MRNLFTASAVASVVALSACAPADSGAGGATMRAAAPERQCFSVGQITNFEQGRLDQIFLRVGRNDVYELHGAGCRDADFAQQLALIPDGGTVGSRLCSHDWARVVVPGSTSAASVCRVRVSRQLTPEEVAAIPERYRP